MNETQDAHNVVLSVPGHEAHSFFGVYDGHGGAAISRHCELHSLRVICEQVCLCVCVCVCLCARAREFARL